MRKRVISRALLGVTLLGTPLTVGLAQTGWIPGSEITGHAIQVETNGVMNTVYFEPGGVARIQSPAGNVVPATWTATGGELCLQSTGGRECWPYAQPFQTGQQITLTSSCQVASRWLPISTSQPPIQQGAGERG